MFIQSIFVSSVSLYVMSIFPTVPFSGVRIHVDPTQASVFAVRGSNVTLPCRFWYEPELSSPTREVRVKWSWLPASGGQEVDVMVAIGSRCRSFGNFRLLKRKSYYFVLEYCCVILSDFNYKSQCVDVSRGRVQLRRDVPGDAALFMTELQLNDTGRYRCEVVDGLEDKSTFIDLELRGNLHSVLPDLTVKKFPNPNPFPPALRIMQQIEPYFFGLFFVILWKIN